MMTFNHSVKAGERADEDHSGRHTGSTRGTATSKPDNHQQIQKRRPSPMRVMAAAVDEVEHEE